MITRETHICRPVCAAEAVLTLSLRPARTDAHSHDHRLLRFAAAAGLIRLLQSAATVA